MSQIPEEQPSKSKAVARKYSGKEVIGIIREIAFIKADPDLILKELGENILPTLYDGTVEEKEIAHKKLNEMVVDALILDELDNHYFLAETASEKYRPLAIDYARKLSKEYNCTTPSEKGLVELIAGSYIRYIEYSKAFNNAMRLDYLSNEKTGYYTMLSKEIDKAYRQYLNGLSMLRQIKNPPPEWNIKANNAYIAQNQQVNTVKQPEVEKKPNEINDPK